MAMRVGQNLTRCGDAADRPQQEFADETFEESDMNAQSARLRNLALVSLAALSAAAMTLHAGVASDAGEGSRAAEKVLRIPMTTDGPKSLDPVLGSTTYENRCCSQIYDTLVQYKYLKRPYELEPSLLEEMPAISADGLVWHFKLKQGVYFQDDPCFPDGKGREVVASDVFYSWKRVADPKYQFKSFWLLEDTIVGFDEFKLAQEKAATFDYSAPVEGMRLINDCEFELTLKRPVQQFMWRLAQFQLSIVPREAIEKYGDRFNRHPVGTGPFILRSEDDWKIGTSLTLHRNPTYREEFYPDEWMPEDEAFGFHKPAGTRLPIVDRIEVTFFVESQPMWLKFEAGELDYTTVPETAYESAFARRSRNLRPAYANRGITAHKLPLLDFIFRGFNMEDPLLGGYTEEKKALRKAICLALDWEEMNEAYYNGTALVYDGMIPPGLDGYPADGRLPNAWRGPDLERAREYLARAGYPDGEGLPTIDYYTSNGATSERMAALTARQLAKVNIKINPRLVDFSTLIEAVDNKKAPFFSFAWGSDYPDAENNLALFYGPNEAPKPNHFNYKNAEFDALYEKIRTMPPGPERTAIYEKMRDMVLEDCPYAGSMARIRHYLVHPWLLNYKPSETFFTWMKYLDVDDSKRPGASR